MEECERKNWFVSNKFGISIPDSAPYFLEVGVRVSLKVVSKGSFRGEENYENLDFQAIFLNQKRRSANGKIEVSAIDLA